MATNVGDSPGDGSTLKHLPQLDALRGAACLLVLAAHLSGVRGMGWMPIELGVAGVGVFFVLSGFLITRILLEAKAAGAAGGGLSAFYNRRMARIFPIYFLTLLVVGLFHPAKELGWCAVFSFNLRYTSPAREYFMIPVVDPIPPVAHFWSLCVEEHFYWVWPMLVWVMPRRFLSWIPCVLIVATPFFTAMAMEDLRYRLFQPDMIAGLIARGTPMQLVGLSLGALAALHEARLGTRGALFGRQVPMLPILGVALVLLAGLAPSLFTQGVLDRGWRRYVDSSILHVACAGVFALGMSWPWLGGVRWLKAAGRISFGLYLYHLPIYHMLRLNTPGPHAPWRGVVAILGCVALAWASFRWIERPIIDRMRRRPGMLTWRRGRWALSLGTALTFALALGFVGSAYAWTRIHPRKTPIPKELAHREIKVPGAHEAFMWMGQRHVQNEQGYRRMGPIPPREPGAYRVAVMGDSYVYGMGVAEDALLSAALQRRLRERGVPADCVNLGRPGLQPATTLDLLRGDGLATGPRMVVYAYNLGDLIPSTNNSTNPPGKTMIQLLDAEPALEKAFVDAVAGMGELCQSKGVGFVAVGFLQSGDVPDYVAVFERVERLLAGRGVVVAPLAPYLQAVQGRRLAVSEWEPHPNAECHDLIAGEVAKAVYAAWEKSRR